jgi:hypothetical protein
MRSYTAEDARQRIEAAAEGSLTFQATAGYLRELRDQLQWWLDCVESDLAAKARDGEFVNGL